MAGKLLFLTEGGEQIGLGHISRCSAICNYYSSQINEADILIEWNGNVANPTPFNVVNWRNDTNAIVELCKAFQWVLVDSYKATLDHYSLLKQHFEKVFVIDDYGRFYDFGVDLIINPNIYGRYSIPYMSDFIGGKDYVILRESFRNSSVKKKVSNKLDNLLITVGGSDVKNMLPMIANSLTDLNFHFDFICGNNEYAEQLCQQYSNRHNYTFHGFVEESLMRELMLKADIAISACGQTLHELAYLGIPTIGICIGEDQIMNRNAYLEAGFISKPMDWNSPGLPDLILGEIQNLYSLEVRVRKSELGKSLIDGHGIERIAEAFLDA